MPTRHPHARLLNSLVALVTLASITLAVNRAAFAAPPAPPPIAPQIAPLAAEQVLIPDPLSGFYIENGTSNIQNPNTYHAVGSFRFWSWATLNPNPGVYGWAELDNWMSLQLAAGYQGLGIALVTYSNRSVSCPRTAADYTPAWVRAGPDGIAGNADDPIIIAANPDTRNCDGNGISDPWPLIDYSDPYYHDRYAEFVQALAEHLKTHPDGDKVRWVATGVGRDGENKPADTSDKANFGYTSQQWIDIVNDITDTYRNAFADAQGNVKVQILSQNGPFYDLALERREIAAHANAHQVGVSLNGITADFNYTEACGHTSTNLQCTGMWDQARLYYENVPIAFESYGYMMATENEFYWSTARALDVHADYIRLSAFYPTNGTATNIVTAEWAAKYIGRGFDNGELPPPSIWSRAREHRIPCFYNYGSSTPEDCNYWPTVGNYEFFLKQIHTAPNGVTRPVTDDPRVTTTGWSGVTSSPWHYNTGPYDQKLNNVGLYQLNNSGSRIQTQVDPGWAARRSDQAGGNYRFYYEADDRYVSAASSPNNAVITITYLDTGNDRWTLQYDGVNGATSALVYAVQPWGVRTGLAIDGGLPTSGLVNPRTAYVQKTNTGQWKTATFYIEDGYFGNRLPGGADFFIDTRSDAGANDGDEYIHHVDFQWLPRNSVSGVISDLVNNQPLANATVRAFRFDGLGWQEAGSGASNANGAFSLNQLAPGPYRLTFGDSTHHSETFKNACDLDGGQTLTVTDGSTTTGIDAALAPNSLPSPVCSTSISATPQGVQLQWEASAGNVHHYEVWRSDQPDFTPGAQGQKLGEVPAAGPLTFTDSTGSLYNAALNYNYIVLAINAAGRYSDVMERASEFDFDLAPASSP